MPLTIRDLSKMIGVSPTTISLVINGKGSVSQETRDKVLSAVQETGYVPLKKYAAPKHEVLLLQYRGNGYLVEENQGFISAIIDSMEKNLRANSYCVRIMNLSGPLKTALLEIDFEPYDGVILIASEIDPSMYPDIAQIPLPFVVMDNPVPDYLYETVCMNNIENVGIVLRYVKEMGFTSLGLISSSIPFENFRIRTEAFHSRLKEYGLSFSGMQYALRPDMKGAYEDMMKILAKQNEYLTHEKYSQEPTAFFAVNDIIALGAVRAFQNKGYRVPQEISVIGFDDIAYAAMSTPALTTIHVQRRNIGIQAVRQLLGRMHDPLMDTIKVQFTGRLIERKSVRRVN